MKRRWASTGGVVAHLLLPQPRTADHDAVPPAAAAEGTESVLDVRVPRPRSTPSAAAAVARATARVRTALPADVERDLAALALVELPPSPHADTDPETDVATARATSAAPDFARQLLRVSELVTFGAFVLLVISAMLAARFGEASLRVHELPFAIWGLGAAVSALTLAALVGAADGPGGLRRRSFTSVLMLALLACVTGVVANAGGVAGPAWVLFVPVVLVAGAVAGPALGLLIGAAATVGVYVAAGFSDTLTVGGVARLVVILPALPAAGWSAGALARLAHDAAAEAQWRRQSLESDVRNLTATLERVAAGDLTVVPAAGNDADPVAASMAVAFADTLIALRWLLRQMDGVASQLSSSAVDLAGAAQQEAAAVGQQVAAVAETTTTIEQLAATAAGIADTAVRVSQFAGSTRRDVDAGVTAVDDANVAMERIADRVADLGRRSAVVRDRIGRIASTTQSIDDLARRTTILAVNASIEAARAGDNGHGFATVAAEVAKLADRAREATSRISAIVGDLEAEADATAAASREGHEAVAVGAALQEDVVASLAQIVAMVDRTTAASREITEATRVQRGASDAVVAAMTTVTSASDRHREGSRRHADAAGRLRDLAEGLGTTLGRFRIR